MIDNGYDETDGTIIGGFFIRYEFWQKHPVFGWLEKVADEYFESDEDAINWFAETHPDEYRRGAEMRVFDQPGRREQAIIDARLPRGAR